MSSTLRRIADSTKGGAAHELLFASRAACSYFFVSEYKEDNLRKCGGEHVLAPKTKIPQVVVAGASCKAGKLTEDDGVRLEVTRSRR